MDKEVTGHVLMVVTGLALVLYTEQIFGILRPGEAGSDADRFPKAVMRLIGWISVLVGGVALLTDVAAAGQLPQEVGASGQEKPDVYLLAFGVAWITIAGFGLCFRRTEISRRLEEGLSSSHARRLTVVLCAMAVVAGGLMVVAAVS